ncbi:unnamed protein product [Spirodela intermedia]|uniref:Uncharacterized protein n=1 Tax=Spirodela intermedia TaxID=51605 RepID=A0A7I8K6F4_SPIIN|nr:unnamed protein product [Spirodela intermedia]
MLAKSSFSRVYDHSLPHSRLATSDVEGERRTPLLFMTIFLLLNLTYMHASLVNYIFCIFLSDFSMSFRTTSFLSWGVIITSSLLHDDLEHENVIDQALIFFLFPSISHY